MFPSEWREFPSAPCLAGKKKTWWQLASQCCWNRASAWHASELVSFLVGLRTYQHPDCRSLKVNINYFPKDHQLFFLCNGDALCFLSCRNWILWTVRGLANVVLLAVKIVTAVRRVRVTVIFVMSLCPSVRMEQLGWQWQYFREILYFASLLLKSVD